MKLTVLGAGACVLTSTRACSGYWIESGSVRLRLDAWAGTMHAMTRFGLPWETITHQFISHFQLDHCGELPGLLWCFRFGRRAPRTAPLEILGPLGLRDLLDLPRFFGGVNVLVAEERLVERLAAGYGGEITVAEDGLTIE